MSERVKAIYARQSVDRPDSISIESQIEFCKYELRGAQYREYADCGYSGKNIDRPQLRRLIQDVKRGVIDQVVVYKLDRISRSILDFSNMMELFQSFDVEFISSTEKFDTSTPMGRAMLNICIVFAQLERETIQNRVADAYYSRSQKGFHMGGRAPIGFRLEPIEIHGISTKRLVVCEEEAQYVRLIFELYIAEGASYGSVTRYFQEHKLCIRGKELMRPTLAQLLRNPVYVKADQRVYNFFKEQGTEIINSVEDFVGENGCYLYQGRDTKKDKLHHLEGQMLVLAPHEGIISSDVWIACRKKLMNNMKIPSHRKVTNTWLAGKIKCGKCGYALMSIRGRGEKRYFRCNKRLDNKSCSGCGTLFVHEVEAYTLAEMRRHLGEIEMEEKKRLILYLDEWYHLKIEEKIEVVDEMIALVAATSSKVEITWKI